MDAIGTLSNVALDCPDPPALARFSSALTDTDTQDVEEAERRVLALGARKHEHQPGANFRVYLDPAGHPFCLCFD